MKSKKISNAQQEVAVDILLDLTFCKDMDDVHKVYKDVYERYRLCDDPFTLLPCTTKEYIESDLEFRKQVMCERLGHCDGLERYR